MQIKKLNVDKTHELYGCGAWLVDVRGEDEWEAGHVRDAFHIPVDRVDEFAAHVLRDHYIPVVTYCASGARAKQAAESLRALGYTSVSVMSGGFQDWKEAGYPVA